MAIINDGECERQYRMVKTSADLQVCGSVIMDRLIVRCGSSLVCEMWWLIWVRCGGYLAACFWGSCPGFKSGISHNDPGALQDHGVIL